MNLYFRKNNFFTKVTAPLFKLFTENVKELWGIFLGMKAFENFSRL